MRQWCFINSEGPLLFSTRETWFFYLSSSIFVMLSIVLSRFFFLCAFGMPPSNWITLAPRPMRPLTTGSSLQWICISETAELTHLQVKQLRTGHQKKKTLEGYFFSSLYHLVIACTARVLPHVHCLHSKAWPDWGCQFCPWSLLAQRGMVRLSMYTPNKVCSGFFYFIFGCVIEVHVFGLFRVLLRLLCLAPQFLSFWSCPKQNWSSWQNWIFFLLWRTYLDFLLSKKSFIDTFWPVVSPSLAFPTRQCTSHFHTNKKKTKKTLRREKKPESKA